MATIPEQYLALAEHARNIFAADPAARMAVVVKTAQGSVLGFSALADDLNPSFDRVTEEERFLQTLVNSGQKKIRQGLCMTRGGELDIPSASLREKLAALDPDNLEAAFLLRGGAGYHVRTLGAMGPRAKEGL